MKETKERVYYELTYPQKSIWSIEQFYPNTNINSIGGVCKILEKVDFDLLIKAFNLTVQKNDGLRLRIVLKDNVPYQYVADHVDINYSVEDISKSDFEEKINEMIPEPIKVEDSPLFNFKLYRFEDGQGAYTSFLHHLICDAWTMSLYVNETMTIYHALKNGASVDDITYPSYLSFIESEKKYKSSSRYVADKEFWNNKFDETYNFTSLKKSGDIGSTEFARKTFKLPSEILGMIESLEQKHGISAPSFLLSAFSLYFSRLLSLDSFTVGTPILNRSSFAEKNMFGAFISTMPLIINYDGEETFIERTQTLLKDQKTMFRHLKYPYSEIAKKVKELTGSSDKLYDVVFSYQNAHSDVNKIDVPFFMKWIPSNNQLESLMIHITDTNDSGNLFINYDYQLSAFSEEDINNMHERMERIMYQVLANDSILCKNIEIISLQEKNKLLRDFIDTECTFNRNSTIIQEFEKGVKEHPEIVAVSLKDTQYTYNELNNLANQLALELIKNGVKPNDVVGILLSRSPEIIISILAILKAGATYMPIEPEYPRTRIDYMIENSKASAIISTKSLEINISSDANRIILDNIKFDKNKNVKNLDLKYDPDSLAYIMYTSGTTGLPKAVMIRNYSVLNFADSMKRRLDYTPSSNNKVLSVTTMCFDIFVFEVFPTLLFGLHLVIANEEEQKSPVLLSELIEKEKICKVLTTPSRIQLLFLDSKYLSCLKTIKELILGGEPFPSNFIHDLPRQTKARIFNLYGPTETTVYSTFKELTNEQTITIGKPIENTTIYVLDKNRKLLPIGCHGELYIGGSGVAKGYYRNKELTNEKFVINPYNKHEIIYNTGDLATWLPDGELLCFGRTDNQVKIRGYRIELGDIESHISNYPGITKAVVIVRSSTEGKQFLCAYYTSREKIEGKDLHKYLVSCLPNYMVPSSYMQLASFPLTPNHKVNKKALPEPTSFISNTEEYVAPSTEAEKIICKVAQEVLGVDRIGINDDLFNYAADSLSIIQIQTLLIPYNMKFKTQDFYNLRNIYELAKVAVKSSETAKSHVDDDLYAFNSIISKNKKIKDLKYKRNEKGYFLSGTTGYLGIHILHELLEKTSSDVYCPIREKDSQSCESRLLSQWKYFFGNEPVDFARVHIVNCDLTKKDFDLSKEELKLISDNVSCFINSAANVKYYGEYSKHELINVIAVKNQIDFCLEHDKYFYQISTMGVSGNYLVTQNAPNTLFTENDFYIGQNYDENVYIRSKFEAEKEIYKAKEKGLRYNIFRVGNLTARISDGAFQKNKDENAFYNILKFIASNGIVPRDMINQSLEFTPVDLCAKAIVALSRLDNIDCKTFHIFNEHYLPLATFIHMLNDSGISVDILPSEIFSKQLISLSQSVEMQNSLKAVVNDLDSKHGLSFMPSVVPNNEITNSYLKKLGFKWPEISFDYINKTLKTIND